LCTTAVNSIPEISGTCVVGAVPTVSKAGADLYVFTFPSGTWRSFPTMTVSPFGIFGAVVVPVVAGQSESPTGGATFDVDIFSNVGTAAGTSFSDNAFELIAAGSLSRTPQGRVEPLRAPRGRCGSGQRRSRRLAIQKSPVSPIALSRLSSWESVPPWTLETLPPPRKQ
jgi:hypothetical protein